MHEMRMRRKNKSSIKGKWCRYFERLNKRLQGKKVKNAINAYNRAEYLTQSVKMMQYWADFLEDAAKSNTDYSSITKVETK